MNIEFRKIQPNLDELTIGERKIYLVGTAHVSKSSVELAVKTIRDIKPDAVAVELCESRFLSLKDPNRWRNLDIIKVLKEGKSYVLLFQLILASYQKKLGDSLQIMPGAEMLEAIKVSEELNIPIILADREVKITLRRAWHNLRFSNIALLFISSLWHEIKGWFKESSKITENQIEALKDQDALELMMKEFSEALPDLKEPLIDERDQYLSSKIFNNNYKIIVAVVGAGHVPGMKKIFGQNYDLRKLEEIPPASKFGSILSILIPVLILLTMLLGFFSGGSEKTLHIAYQWIIYTAVSAGIGGVITLAHPLSIICAMISVPITTIHAGWAAGFVEAIIRKPQVKDLENVLDDITTLKGIWTNKITRIFLVMTVTNVTTLIGMIWATKIVASIIR